MTEDGIDNLCAYLDDLLLDGEFEEVDQWYADLLEDEERLAKFVDEDLSRALTHLMVSNGSGDRLPHRQKFYHYVEDRLLSVMSEEDVRAHLGNLGNLGPEKYRKC